MVSDPTLLVADEPTGDLDRHSATEVLEILKRLERRVPRDDCDGRARSARRFLCARHPASGEGNAAATRL